MSFRNLHEQLQNISEAIMSITGLDVTIADKKLKRIAGTGKSKFTIGKNISQKNSVFSKCLETGQPFIVIEPRTCQVCSECNGREECNEEAEFCYPILTEKGVEGVIGLIAYTPEQKKNFIDKQQSYINFVSRMSQLISSRIAEEALHRELRYKTAELRAAIDAVDEGILSIDDRGRVLYSNQWLEKVIGIREKDLIGKNIDDVIPNNSVTKVLKTNKAIKDQEEVLDVKGNKVRFLLTVKPIIFDSEKAGAVATFKDFDKLHRSIIKIRENPETLTFQDIIGHSPIFQKTKEQAKQVARQDVTVLLLGDSGTGKELFARAIHQESLRRKEIFLPINCGAIPESLIESELFGYEKGSFTGGNPKGKMGKFEMAHGGTVFLDEIGDLPLHMQVKLLRVLQEREIFRIGGLSPIKVDIRVIAATNKDLWDMVQRGEFREDLFYRLNVVPIKIPPLRERPEDILELATVLCERFCKVHNKRLKGITKAAQEYLMSCSFPGNVRELQNLIEYGVIFEKGRYLTAEVLQKKSGIREEVPQDLGSLRERVARYERGIISDLLNSYGRDTEAKKRIARHLQISTATLYRKLKDLDIE